MSIKEKTKKVKEGIGEWGKKFIATEKPLFTASLVILTAFLAFGLGRLSKIEEMREPIRIENIDSAKSAAAITLTENNVEEEKIKESLSQKIVASKHGKKYHYIWCVGAKSIKEENKIFFTTEAEAESHGYTLAANCKK